MTLRGWSLSPGTPAIILDIEASSLGPGGFPLEVAWCVLGPTRKVVSALIAPDPDWLEHGTWDPAAAEMHGLTIEYLQANGEQPGIVADRLNASLAGCHVFTTAPSVDSSWLGILLECASSKAYFAVMHFDELLGGSSPDAVRRAYQLASSASHHRHRAAGDVSYLLAVLEALNA